MRRVAADGCAALLENVYEQFRGIDARGGWEETPAGRGRTILSLRLAVQRQVTDWLAQRVRRRHLLLALPLGPKVCRRQIASGRARRAFAMAADCCPPGRTPGCCSASARNLHVWI